MHPAPFDLLASDQALHLLPERTEPLSKLGGLRQLIRRHDVSDLQRNQQTLLHQLTTELTDLLDRRGDVRRRHSVLSEKAGVERLSGSSELFHQTLELRA